MVLCISASACASFSTSNTSPLLRRLLILRHALERPLLCEVLPGPHAPRAADVITSFSSPLRSADILLSLCLLCGVPVIRCCVTIPKLSGSNSYDLFLMILWVGSARCRSGSLVQLYSAGSSPEIRQLHFTWPLLTRRLILQGGPNILATRHWLLRESSKRTSASTQMLIKPLLESR